MYKFGKDTSWWFSLLRVGKPW